MSARRTGGVRRAPFLGLVLIVVVGIAIAARDVARIETAPAVPPRQVEKTTAAPAPAPPASGPWFVDRARDFGLDVVTRCGDPGKSSILDSLGAGVALFDHDGDGDLDLFVTACSRVDQGVLRSAGGPWLFRNEGPGRWKDITEVAGLTYTGWAQAPAVADHDGDGDLDLFVAQCGPDVLWSNQGDGTFRNVTAAAGLGSETYWGVGATWGDHDGDGDLDLYVTNYLAVDPVRPAPMIDYKPGFPVFAGPSVLPGEPDRLWRNLGNGRFEDVTASAGVENRRGKGMAALFVDLDDDGKVDLYVTNDTQANEFFHNLGGGKFREEGLAAGVGLNGQGRPEGSMGIDVADVDGDGRLDLAHSNFRHEGSRLHRNLGSAMFQDVSTENSINIHTLRFVGWGIVLADFDDDGWPDLFQANGHVYPGVPDSDYAQPPIFLRNLGDGRFARVTAAWGHDLESAVAGGRAVAVGDLDGDGDLDLVITTMDGPLRVLINEGTSKNHAARVGLVGNPPNREALGARVELQTARRTHVDQVRRGGSFLAASDATLHFGLGDADRIERLTVRWPTGSMTSCANLPVDSTIIIHQRDGRVESHRFQRPDPPVNRRNAP